MLLTGRERCRQLRPVAVLAALNLGKFIDQLPAAAVEVIHHGLALRLQAKAALALPVSRDPEVSDEFAPMCRHNVLPVVTVRTLYRRFSVYTSPYSSRSRGWRRAQFQNAIRAHCHSRF